MASRSLGTLTIDLIARTGGFEQGLGKAERASGRWRKKTEDDAKAAGVAITRSTAAVAAAAAAAAGSIALLARQGVEVVSAQQNLADSLDTTYDSITALKLAAGDSGLEGLEGSLTRLNRRLGAAEKGAGAAANAVKALNLDLAALSRMTVDERVATIADAIRDSGVSMQRAARFAQDLGFEQREAAKFFTQGGDAIRAYRGEVDRLGLSLSDLDAARVQEAASAMGIFGDLTRAASQQLAVELAPAILTVTDAAKEFAESGDLEKWVGRLHLVADAATVVAVVLGSRVAGAAATTAISFAAATRESIRYQAALARMAGVSTATAIRLTAMGAAARAASASLALVGGPAGAAILAGAGLIYFSSRASSAERESERLQQRIGDLGDSFDDLSRITAASALDDAIRNQELLAEAAEKPLDAISRLTRQQRLTGVSTKESAEAFREFREALNSGADVGEATDRFLASMKPADNLAQAVRRLAKEYEESAAKAQGAADVVDRLRQRLDDLSGAAAAASGEIERSEAYEKLNKQINERLALIGATTEAERLAARISSGSIEGLLDGEAELLIALQRRADEQEAAVKAAEEARRAEESAEKSRLESISQEISAIERAAIVWGMSADEVKLYDLALKGATESQINQAKALLEYTEIQERQAKINEEAAGIAESLRTEEERILASYERRRQIILDNTKITGEAQTELLRRLEEERNEQLLEINGGYWQRYLAAMEDNLMSADQMTANVLENLGRSFGDTFESMIFDAESLGDSFRKMAEGMARSMVNALGEMAGQWLVYQVVKSAAIEETSSLADTEMIANATATAAQAALAAYASTAAIPITGPSAAPAAMAGALSATAPYVAAVTAAVGMAHDGIDSIPKTGTWILEKGERVVTSETSAKLDATLEDIRRNGGGGGVTRIEVINDGSLPAIEGEARMGPDGQMQIIVRAVRRELSNDINNGRGIALDLERRYSMPKKGVI